MTVLLLFWLVAVVAFTLWLRRRDHIRSLEAWLTELPPLTVTVDADLTKFTEAMRDARRSAQRLAGGSGRDRS